MDKTHANKAYFKGVLTQVDTVSTKAPAGARGHKVILLKSAAKLALPSLKGMAIDFKGAWDGHNQRQKCGIITNACFKKNNILVKGFIYKRDYIELPAIIKSIQNTLGMSYEIADAHVIDMTKEVWTLSRVTFTGAAILLKDKAAYKDTSFELLPLIDNSKSKCISAEEEINILGVKE